MRQNSELTPEERDRYQWQLWTPGFGEAGQQLLKNASVLISRIGGVGGTVAMQLAAAGVGKLILAHAGNVRRNDLNRQLLMTTAGIDKPRVESARRRLLELNPHVEIEAIAENVSPTNVARLVGGCNVIVSAAPLFEERLLMNREAVQQQKPMIDCAMYDLEGRVMTIVPGQSACLACLYTAAPRWKREFPVFGAVASTVGSLAAIEVIKIIAGLGKPLIGRLLAIDAREMSFQSFAHAPRPDCEVCGNLFSKQEESTGHQ